MSTVVHATAESILANLKIVDGERRRRARQPGLSRAVAAVKAFQQRRFATTYGDLLASARYGNASRFFLDELYGPSDFSHRDTQFARVVPALVRLFPSEVVQTVATLAELHALSETLDCDGHPCRRHADHRATVHQRMAGYRPRCRPGVADRLDAG